MLAATASSNQARNPYLRAYVRQRARQSLIAFTKYTYPAYQADPAHILIASYLDRVIRGEIKNLMIFAYPQMGKSELVSVRFPALWLGHYPNSPILMTAYGSDLIEKHSRAARAVVNSIQYQRLFPNIRISNVSKAVDHWELLAAHRAYVHAVGIDGSMTGFGGKCGIMDDPYKGWREAQSPTVRRKVSQFWKGDFLNRLWEGAVKLLTLTRWNPEDLPGEIIAEEGEKWIILRIPALGESQSERDRRNKLCGLPAGLPDPLGRKEDEPAAPHRHSKETLLERQKTLGDIIFEAQYQGSPIRAEGSMFRREWYDIVDASPRDAERVRYWDKAGTEGGTGARTAGVLMAKSDRGFFIEDIIAGYYEAADREALIRQTAEIDRQRYGHVRIFFEQEPGSGGKESAQNTVTKTLVGFEAEADRVTGDKVVRATPMASQAKARNIKLVKGPWNGEYLDELATFPFGKRKDLVDGSSGALNKLAEDSWQVY